MIVAFTCLKYTIKTLEHFVNMVKVNDKDIRMVSFR